MSESGRFRVSLHVSHPTLLADFIVSSFAFPLRYARSVGALRMNKQGDELGGVYGQTDISFSISDGVVSNDEVLLSDFVDMSMGSLPLDAINQIIASGGSCFFFIGVYSEGNILCDFDAGLLSRLSVNGIDLKIDFYGGPE